MADDKKKPLPYSEEALKDPNNDYDRRERELEQTERHRAQTEQKAAIEKVYAKRQEINYKRFREWEAMKYDVAGRPGAMRRVSEPTYLSVPNDHPGGLFGIGNVDPTEVERDLWMPRDTWNRDRSGAPTVYVPGKSRSIRHSETRTPAVSPGEARFQSKFESQDFHDQWVADRMAKMGYVGESSVGSRGYSSALRRAEAQWGVFRKDMQQKKDEWLYNQWKTEQDERRTRRMQRSQKAAPTPPPSADKQVSAADASATDVGLAAAASKLPVTYSDYAFDPASYAARLSAHRPRLLNDMTDLLEEAEAAMRARKPGPRPVPPARPAWAVGKTGRRLRNGQIFFGTDTARREYEKKLPERRRVT